MSKNRHRPLVGALLFAFLSSAQLFSQMTVTGSIVGNILDPSGQAVPAAKVTLMNEKTGDARSSASNEQGAFTFVAVPPDTYTVKVERGGFKTFQRTGLVITANEHATAGDIELQIGAVSETVSVEATGATVQTDSSENSAVLTSTQLDTLTTRGREVVSLLRTIPGVQYQADQDSVGGSFGTGTPNIG